MRGTRNEAGQLMWDRSQRLSQSDQTLVRIWGFTVSMRSGRELVNQLLSDGRSRIKIDAATRFWRLSDVMWDFISLLFSLPAAKTSFLSRTRVIDSYHSSQVQTFLLVVGPGLCLRSHNCFVSSPSGFYLRNSPVWFLLFLIQTVSDIDHGRCRASSLGEGVHQISSHERGFLCSLIFCLSLILPSSFVVRNQPSRSNWRDFFRPISFLSLISLNLHINKRKARSSSRLSSLLLSFCFSFCLTTPGFYLSSILASSASLAPQQAPQNPKRHRYPSVHTYSHSRQWCGRGRGREGDSEWTSRELHPCLYQNGFREGRQCWWED